MSDRTTSARTRYGWRFWLAIAAGAVVGVPLVLVAAVLLVLNLDAGQRYAERLTARLTGGTVQLTGLHGRVPDALRLDKFALRDAQGVWLTGGGLVLDWSPLHLLADNARVARLTAQSIAVLRLPVSNAPAKPADSSFRLPVSVDVADLAVADLSLGPAVAGAAAQLAVTGQAHVQNLSRGAADLAVRRLDAPGAYAVQAVLGPDSIRAHLSAQEPARGLISMAARLPDLGALGLDATLDGPMTGAALRLALAAGDLRAGANGTLDLKGKAADLAVTATAPAMTLAPGTSWQSIQFATTLKGPFTRPAANGTLDVVGLQAGGAAIGRIAARIVADTHTASLTAQAQDVQLPAPNQSLLAGGPLTLAASINLDDPARPVSYSFDQALLHGQGNAVLAPDLRASLVVSVPDLEKLAQPRGRDVAGNAGFTLNVLRHQKTSRFDVDAHMAVTGGADAPPAARGDATLGATVTLDDTDIILSRLKLDGATVHLDATGARRSGQVTAEWHLAAADLHELTPSLRGALDMTGTMAGTQAVFAAQAKLAGTLGTAAIAPAPVSLTLSGTGLPANPAGHIEGVAHLAGADLTLNVDATRDADQTLTVTINRADWKSAMISGAFSLAHGATLPVGKLDIALKQLDDLRPLLNQPIAGSLVVSVDLPPSGTGTLHLDARNAGLPGRASVASAVLDATITNPENHPAIAGTLAVTGAQTGGVAGDLRLDARGPADALALKLTSTLHQLAGAPATLAASAVLNTVAKQLRMQALAANWRDEALSLVAPATLTYTPSLAVDRLRLVAVTQGAAPASLDIAGKISPDLSLTIAAGNITPALARPFAPSLDADGLLRLDARLAGTPSAPTGTIRLAATGLRMRSGPARGLAPANLTATATLAGSSAQLDAQFTAGPTTHLAVHGAVPLSATGALGLHAEGGLSLALLDPILTAQGRRLRGTATLDATIDGAPAAPTVAGTLRLADGEVQDYGQGIHISDIAARIDATGDSIHIAQFSGRAGGGTIGVSGSVGLRGPMPVDIAITADNARPITSDLVTATLDANLAITGDAQTSIAAHGRIHVRRADVQVPDKLPASIAVLDVRRPGDKPPPPPGRPALQIPLDITLDAPQQIFVRGHGLDAELGGALHIGGTAAAPQTSGSFDLRNGTFSLAGQTLTFTSGNISFNGAQKIDPALDLIATESNTEIAATLTVGGYASAPTITLSSVPDRPQDEILAALLFHQSSATLSPFQLAQIAAALAQVSGIGGGVDPISRLRKGLGLDRLSVGSSGTGSSATTSVEAGRYVRPGVYVGAKQGTTGSQTQAEVQIDITKGLKLNTDIGNGSGANDVGLTYQFQY